MKHVLQSYRHILRLDYANSVLVGIPHYVAEETTTGAEQCS